MISSDVLSTVPHISLFHIVMEGRMDRWVKMFKNRWKEYNKRRKNGFKEYLQHFHNKCRENCVPLNDKQRKRFWSNCIFITEVHCS